MPFHEVKRPIDMYVQAEKIFTWILFEKFCCTSFWSTLLQISILISFGPRQD